MRLEGQIRHVALLIVVVLSLFAVCAASPSQTADDPNGPPSLVEVYWQSSKTVVIHGITNLIALDPEIARVETGYDTVQFFCLERGETVVLGYMGNKPVSIRVRVVARPVILPTPAMLRRQSELAQGIVGSNVQVFNNQGATTVALLSNFAWSQFAGDNGRLDVNAQVEDNNYIGGHAFNIRNGSIFFHHPNLEVHSVNYVVSLTNNDPRHYVSPNTISDYIQLRGASLTLKHGTNEYMFFGGTTLPFFYLTLGSTSAVGGFSFLHKQSEKFSL